MFLKRLIWLCKIILAVLLGQTLFFKFAGAVESKYIFSTLGVEPWGRIGSGVVEAIAIILLFIRPLFIYGAYLSLMTMGGAIASHLTFLGIEIEGEFEGQMIEGDNGLLFILALLSFASALFLILSRKKS